MSTDEATIAPPASAAPKRPEDITKSTDFYLVVAALALLLFIGALALWIAERWRKRRDRDAEPVMSLTNFRAMFEAGEITQEEYERIRLKMAGKLKAKLGVTPSPPEPPPPKSE